MVLREWYSCTLISSLGVLSRGGNDTIRFRARPQPPEPGVHFTAPLTLARGAIVERGIMRCNTEVALYFFEPFLTHVVTDRVDWVETIMLPIVPCCRRIVHTHVHHNSNPSSQSIRLTSFHTLPMAEFSLASFSALLMAT